ncbi:MAG: FHA domain-containing protein [Anaerolineales bacterium]
MANKLRAVILALIFSLLFTSWLSAQEADQARLTPPDIESFPIISTFLDVRDAEGNFIAGLERSEISVLENGRRLPVLELEQLRPGVQFVTAINPGTAFNVRDLLGVTRYEYIYEVLEEWAYARQGTTLDDLSLLTVNGPVATHLSDTNTWISTLQPYQPENGSSELGFELLGRSLELAAEDPSRPGMGKAVLFITDLPQDDMTLYLESLAVRARQRDVRVFIWLVTSANLYHTPFANQLQNLADQTGGKFFAYSGIEPLPDLEDYLEPLRSTYLLTYESALNSSGLHQIAVHIRTDEVNVTSPEQEIEIEVLPPNVAFISPGQEIKREVSTVEEGETEEITPKQYELEVIIEFPDGHTRPMERSRLFVDEQLAHENTASPFDRFTWDLSEYTSSDTHKIRVEVVDSLGLSGNSLEHSIMVSIVQSQQNNPFTFTRNRSLLVGLVVLVTGSILLLILVMGGRIQPGFSKPSRNGNHRSDPVTQPVKAKTDRKHTRLPEWFNRLSWPHRRVEAEALAMLIRISETEPGKTSPPIPIVGDELTFGRDPTLATQVLEDPSVETIHARLRLDPDNVYRLYDEKSIAGTWVNFTPISPEGVRLEHGDLIHIGRVGFRFSLRDPQKIRKPVITKKELNL